MDGEKERERQVKGREVASERERGGRMRSGDRAGTQGPSHDIVLPSKVILDNFHQTLLNKLHALPVGLATTYCNYK